MATIPTANVPTQDRIVVPPSLLNTIVGVAYDHQIIESILNNPGQAIPSSWELVGITVGRRTGLRIEITSNGAMIITNAEVGISWPFNLHIRRVFQDVNLRTFNFGPPVQIARRDGVYKKGVHPFMFSSVPLSEADAMNSSNWLEMQHTDGVEVQNGRAVPGTFDFTFFSRDVLDAICALSHDSVVFSGSLIDFGVGVSDYYNSNRNTSKHFTLKVETDVSFFANIPQDFVYEFSTQTERRLRNRVPGTGLTSGGRTLSAESILHAHIRAVVGEQRNSAPAGYTGAPCPPWWR